MRTIFLSEGFKLNSSKNVIHRKMINTSKKIIHRKMILNTFVDVLVLQQIGSTGL